MTTIEAMLRAHPSEPETGGHPLSDLASVIEVLTTCATTCTQCADACLAEDDVASLVACIRLDLDCADVCAATARLIARQGGDAGTRKLLLDACRSACAACAQECEGHAEHMEHCRTCAAICRRCERACAELLAALR